jgi:mono/diheme cytochrome c family protein
VLAGSTILLRICGLAVFAMRLTVIVVILTGLTVLEAQRSTADGVYSLDQAERGRGRYASACQGCHAADLSGGVGSALKGDQFRSDWGGLPLARLFERIRTMPPSASAPQPEDAAVELLAHVLAANGFPPGETLSIERLDDIRFQSGERSDAVPDFALVQVFGCITSRTPGEWLITSATAPVRTTNPEPSPEDERLRHAASRGDAAFRLLNAFPSPAKLDGHLAEVKGFLIRGSMDSINVTALTSVTSACQ